MFESLAKKKSKATKNVCFPFLNIFDDEVGKCPTLKAVSVTLTRPMEELELDDSALEAMATTKPKQEAQFCPLVDCIRTRWKQAECTWEGENPSMVCWHPQGKTPQHASMAFILPIRAQAFGFKRKRPYTWRVMHLKLKAFGTTKQITCLHYHFMYIFCFVFEKKVAAPQSRF